MNSKMKMRNGIALRKAFYDKGFKTLPQIANALKLSTRTASKLFSDQNVNQVTVIKVAQLLDVEPDTIAESANVHASDKPTS